jgi:GNAT superfamily N-acetyltransferase
MRPARADDATALADLTTQLGYPADARTLSRRLAPLLGRPDGAVLVAVDDGDRPIGWIHVAGLAILEADERAVIHGLVVDEAHRSGSVGTELLAAAEAWARERGIGIMLVRSRSTRERAHRFYLDRGFAEVKRSHVFEKRLV